VGERVKFPYVFYASELPKLCEVILNDLTGQLDEAAKRRADFNVWFSFDIWMKVF
jgi:hypothetical protein